MRSKHNELGQFATGCPPFDKEVYGPIWEEAQRKKRPVSCADPAMQGNSQFQDTQLVKSSDRAQVRFAKSVHVVKCQFVSCFDSNFSGHNKLCISCHLMRVGFVRAFSEFRSRSHRRIFGSARSLSRRRPDSGFVSRIAKAGSFERVTMTQPSDTKCY